MIFILHIILLYPILLGPFLVDGIDLHGAFGDEDLWGATLEGVTTDLRRIGGVDGHCGQCLTLLEGRTAKFLDSDRQFDVRELEAALECIAADGLKTIGEDGRLQGGALLESGVLNLL